MPCQNALCLAELEKAIPSFLYSREIPALSQPGTTRVLDSDEDATAVLAFALDPNRKAHQAPNLTKRIYPLCASRANVTHAIQYTDDTNASCNATACGLALRPRALAYKLSGLTFCQRKACKAFFAQATQE